MDESINENILTSENQLKNTNMTDELQSLDNHLSVLNDTLNISS